MFEYDIDRIIYDGNTSSLVEGPDPTLVGCSTQRGRDKATDHERGVSQSDDVAQTALDAVNHALYDLLD